MSLTNTAENAIIDLIFNNTDFANVGDAGGLLGSATAGSLYVSLHTSDPGETGDQTTNECAYTSYSRVAVARTSGGFTVSADTATNTAAVTFPAATGGSETATHFGIGTASSGSGILIMSGALSASLAISSGITPEFAIGQLSTSAA